MRVLIVEDDLAARKLLRFILEEVGGHSVVEASSGHQGRDLAADCDLVITDLTMPDGDGFALTRALRTRSSIPIIAVSANRTAVQDRVRALHLGADDYLPKPFDPAELLARVEALHRRSQRANRGGEVGMIHAGELTLDLLKQTVTIKGGHPVLITPTETRLLARLAQDQGQVVSRRALQEALWGNAAQESEAALATYVAGLRRKLEPEPRHPRFLQTVRRAGYRLC